VPIFINVNTSRRNSTALQQRIIRYHTSVRQYTTTFHVATITCAKYSIITSALITSLCWFVCHIIRKCPPILTNFFREGLYARLAPNATDSASDPAHGAGPGIFYRNFYYCEFL